MIDLEPATVEAITASALAAYPRECAGLVTVERGRQRWRPSEHGDADTFRIPATDYAAACDAGEIIAVAHSHPDAPSTPSQADRVVCEETGVPWFIVGVQRDLVSGELHALDWSRIEPCGYEAPLVGCEFSHGINDCYSVIRRWYRRERSIVLPDFPREDEWWNRGLDLYMQQFGQAGFRRLPDGTEPIEGDVLLFQIRSPVANHAGVYLGDGMLLHHLHGRLSSKDVMGGYLQECLRATLRYDPERGHV